MTTSLSQTNPAVPLPPFNALTTFFLSPKRAEEISNFFTDVGLTDFDGVTSAKRVVSISFINGTDNQKAKLRKYAKDWLRGAPTIRFRYTYGVHGRVRVAFDDPPVPLPVWQQYYVTDPCQDIRVPYEKTVDQTVFAYIGRQTLNAFDTPENVHVGSIDPLNPTATVEEAKYIHHAFGHVLGLEFAGKLPDVDWINNVSKTVAPKLGWLQSSFKELFKEGITDKSLRTPSVMEFGWKTGCVLNENDLANIAERYPIPAYIVRHSIQDLAKKSANHAEDLDLYVLDRDDKLYKNRRVYKSTSPQKVAVSWTYWDDILEASLPTPFAPSKPEYSPEDFPRLPTKPDNNEGRVRDYAILDLSDRFEILAVDADGTFKFKQYIKATKEWKSWQKPDEKIQQQPKARKVKIIEIEGGYEVIFLKEDGKLAHFSRKNGDPDLPKEYHLIPSKNKIQRIVAARVGPPSNPVKIFASTETDLYIAELDQALLTWKLTSVEADNEKINGFKNEIAFGMAGTTENAFVVVNKGPADQKLWHNRSSDGGWFDWQQPKGLETVNVVKFSIGESSSKDSESRYLQVFALDDKGYLWYNRVHEEGFWGPSPDVFKTPEDAEKNGDKWVKVAAGDQDSFFGGPPVADDVYVKRAKSGDLMVFLVTKENKVTKERNQIHCLSIDINGFKNKEGKRDRFIPRVWGTWENTNQ